MREVLGTASRISAVGSRQMRQSRMRSVTIAGLGLIGGSIGKALRRNGWRVRYVDPAVTPEQARDAGAADDRARSLVDDELVMLATPVDVAVRQLRDANATIVASACSVMHPLRTAAGGQRFVAGHPFAGSEQSGLAAARDDLFAGRTWFVDRDEALVREMIETCGAEQVVIDAREHDETMALTSHLPQMLSTALASLIEQKGIDPRFIGSGVRTLLRLAGSSHAVWGPVLDANQENIAEAAEELGSLLELLDGDDFERARRLYEALKPDSNPTSS